MAVGVVDRLEAITVEQEKCHTLRHFFHILPEFFPVFVIGAAVVAAGEHILARLRMKFAILVFQRTMQNAQLQLIFVQRTANVFQFADAHGAGMQGRGGEMVVPHVVDVL